MKVIAVDNFARDNVSDRLILQDCTEEVGKRVVKEHNDKMHECSEWYYKLVDEDYKLYKWEP